MHVLSHTCIQSYGSAVHKRWHHGLALLTLNPGSIMWLFLVDLPYPLWSNDLSLPSLKCCLLPPLVYVQLYNINSDVQKCILRCPRLERRWTTQPGDTGAREIQHDQWSMINGNLMKSADWWVLGTWQDTLDCEESATTEFRTSNGPKPQRNNQVLKEQNDGKIWNVQNVSTTVDLIKLVSLMLTHITFCAWLQISNTGKVRPHLDEEEIVRGRLV